MNGKFSWDTTRFDTALSEARYEIEHPYCHNCKQRVMPVEHNPRTGEPLAKKGAKVCPNCGDIMVWPA